jgi:predicted amidophosphoribosyltransferase
MKLLAPNGKPSKLTAEQYRLVRTPAFKAWFGFWDLYGKSKNYYDYGVREIAIALKSEKEYAIKEAVEFLSSQVTKDDVLIPMPSRIGIATDTKKLAEEIAKKTGAKMFNCLVGIERDSIYELKKSNKNVTKFDFKFELNCEIPKARNYFIVDNVIGTGITMKNALQQVIKNLGVVNVNPLVYAIDVKNISKVVDENGCIITECN